MAHSPESPGFRILFDENFDAVWRLLVRLGVRTDEVEDLVQDVFVVAHRRFEHYDPQRPVRPWLYGIARNVARDHRRLARHRREVYGGDFEGSKSDPFFRDFEGSKSDPFFRAFDAAALVYAALAKLAEPLREVLVLRDLEQAPMKEVAATLDLPIDTAFGRLRRARAQFRAAVEELRGSEAP